MSTMIGICSNMASWKEINVSVRAEPMVVAYRE